MANRYTCQRPFTREQLEHEYGVLVMTQTEIAKKHGTTQKVVWSAMRAWSIPARVAFKRDQAGDRNGCWKGSEASYKAFHQRLYRLRGKPSLCEACGASDPSRTYDWASLTGKYDDPSDYKRMCRSCHWKYDDKIANIRKARKKGDHP